MSVSGPCVPGIHHLWAHTAILIQTHNTARLDTRGIDASQDRDTWGQKSGFPWSRIARRLLPRRLCCAPSPSARRHMTYVSGFSLEALPVGAPASCLWTLQDTPTCLWTLHVALSCLACCRVLLMCVAVSCSCVCTMYERQNCLVSNTCNGQEGKRRDKRRKVGSYAHLKHACQGPSPSL